MRSPDNPSDREYERMFGREWRLEEWEKVKAGRESMREREAREIPRWCGWAQDEWTTHIAAKGHQEAPAGTGSRGAQPRSVRPKTLSLALLKTSAIGSVMSERIFPHLPKKREENRLFGGSTRLYIRPSQAMIRRSETGSHHLTGLLIFDCLLMW